MRFAPFCRAVLFVLAGISLILPPAGSAHLHFCLDGQEPPVALHTPDAGDHHDEGDQATDHQDRDVDLPANDLGKSAVKTLDVALPSDFSIAAPGALKTGGRYFFANSARVASVLRFVLPPLRGPPA